MQEMEITLRRTVQIVKYEDTVNYGVTLRSTREPDESDEAFRARAITDTKNLFNEVETAMLAAAYGQDQHGRYPNQFDPLLPDATPAQTAPPPRRKSR